jgi:hypothetical protein
MKGPEHATADIPQNAEKSELGKRNKELPDDSGERMPKTKLPDDSGNRNQNTDIQGKGFQESGDSATEKRETDEIERMEPRVIIKFKCPDGMDQKEFKRQLKGQERGLNSMTVDHWIENRENYKENGRAPEGTEAQRELREKVLQSRIESNQQKHMSYSDSKAEAQKWIEGQAALHNPDQIAGGDPEKVSRMGDAKVNSSIGGQWKSRVDGLESAIKDYAKDKSPEELANTKLNVKLEMEV